MTIFLSEYEKQLTGNQHDSEEIYISNVRPSEDDLHTWVMESMYLRILVMNWQCLWIPWCNEEKNIF